MLAKANFDPSSDEAAAAVQRLDQFHEAVSKAATKYSVALIVNDGVVICRDLSARSTSVTADFIRRVHDLHANVNAYEHAQGLPGCRCVLASGFRLRRMNHGKEALLNGYGAYLVRKATAGAIPILQAIRSAITVKPFVAAMPEAQANFAFTKAYLADDAGSKAGFSGARLFIDLALIDPTPAAGWLQLSAPIPWKSPGISATYAAIESADFRKGASLGNPGCRDAFEVAAVLGGSDDVVTRLRSLRIGGDPKTL